MCDLRTHWVTAAREWIPASYMKAYSPSYLLEGNRFLCDPSFYDGSADLEQCFFTAPIAPFLHQTLRQDRQIAGSFTLPEFLQHVDGPLISFAFTTIRAALQKAQRGSRFHIHQSSQRNFFNSLLRLWARRCFTRDEIKSGSNPEDSLSENLKMRLCISLIRVDEMSE